MNCAEKKRDCMPLNYLVNLNKLGRGIDKQWIYRDPLCKELAHDYLQKINFSIQDINSLLGALGRIEKRTDVISLIVLVDWIADSVWQYKSCVLKEIMDTFTFSRQNDLEKNLAFLKAIRSFIVAHPLNTTKHNALGFSGDRVCIDLRVSQPFAFANINITGAGRAAGDFRGTV